MNINKKLKKKYLIYQRKKYIYIYTKNIKEKEKIE